MISRRGLLFSGMAGIALVRPASAAAVTGPSSELLGRALAALDRHNFIQRDLIAVADFSQPSREARFHLVDVAAGKVSSHLVAHGRGSDPKHTGWLERFSNASGSYASSAGTYRTEEIYFGAHGRSLRLRGLDATNDNAEARGIVVHGAWYVNQEMAALGLLGRSEGCFAMANGSLKEIIARLTPGHLLYADKLA